MNSYEEELNEIKQNSQDIDFLKDRAKIYREILSESDGEDLDALNLLNNCLDKIENLQ